VTAERAATAELALQIDIAAEQAAEFANDRQPQSGAGILAGHGVVTGLERAALAELFEDRLLFLFGDAHARVDDLDHDLRRLGLGIEGGADVASGLPRA